MTNEVVGDNSNKINAFIKIYEELANTLTYDQEYAETAYLEDGLDELSAYEMRQKNTERTKTHKTGGSLTFAMRLSEELDSLGIENYLMNVERNNTKQWVNLYKSNDKWCVADLTEDIIFKDSIKQTPEKKKALYANVLAEEFLLYNGKCSTLEEIKNDGKKIEELQMKTFNYSNIESGKVNQEELSLILRKQNVFEEIKNFFKELLNKIKNNRTIQELFGRSQEAKQDEYMIDETEKEMIEEGILTEANRTSFIPKAKVNEEEAIKIAEEKAKEKETEIEDKSKTN